MKRSDVNLENLLNQLSEEKINRVVDSNVLRAAWGGDEKSSHSGNSGCESKSGEAASGNSGGGTSGGGISVGGSGSVGVSVGAGASGGLGLGF